MYLSFSRAEFAPIIKAAATVATNRSGLPILQCALITAGTGEVFIEATDYDLRMLGPCRADVYSNGAVAVPAKALSDLVAACNGERVTLQTADNFAVLFSCGEAEATLQGMNPNDFPEGASVEGDATEAPWHAIFRAVRFAANPRDPRNVLKGIHVRCNGGKIKAEATDGKVCGVYEIAAPNGTPEFDVVFPFTACRDDVTGIAFGDDDQVRVETASGISFSGRTIAGKFPDVSKVWPVDFKMSLEVERETLLSAIRRASIFAGVQTRHVTFEMAENAILVGAETHDLGKFSEPVPIVEAKRMPDGFSFIFSTNVIGDVLSAADGDTVTLRGNEAHTPWQVTGEDAMGKWLAMPIRLATNLVGEAEATE